jgi:hypothetical protein
MVGEALEPLSEGAGGLEMACMYVDFVLLTGLKLVVRARGLVSISGCLCPFGTFRDSRMVGLYVYVGGDAERAPSSLCV